MKALTKAIENFKTAAPFREVYPVNKHMLMECGVTAGAIDRAIKGETVNLSSGLVKLAKSAISQNEPPLATKARELLSLGKSLRDVCQELGIEPSVLRPWLNDTWFV
jgi:hypothetical protein